MYVGNNPVNRYDSTGLGLFTMLCKRGHDSPGERIQNCQDWQSAQPGAGSGFGDAIGCAILVAITDCEYEEPIPVCDPSTACCDDPWSPEPSPEPPEFGPPYFE